MPGTAAPLMGMSWCAGGATVGSAAQERQTAMQNIMAREKHREIGREERRENGREKTWSGVPTLHAAPRLLTLFFTSLFTLLFTLFFTSRVVTSRHPRHRNTRDRIPLLQNETGHLSPGVDLELEDRSARILEARL